MSSKLIKSIDTGAYGGFTLKFGDLNGDGLPEFLVAQSYRPTREISCLTALTLDGEILWQYGEPSADNWDIYSDLPVQIHDIDGDGFNEVVWIEQAEYINPLAWDYNLGHHVKDTGMTKAEIRKCPWLAVEQAVGGYSGAAVLHVLDGRTGAEKTRFDLPAGADDCLAFANLTSKTGRRDLVVKDRYWNMWGISSKGEQLWHWKGVTGHFPAIGDADGDGYDEIFTSNSLIDQDGTVLWHDKSNTTHQDSAFIIGSGDSSQLIAIESGLRKFNNKGIQAWSYSDFTHGQHAVPIFTQDELMFAGIDIVDGVKPSRVFMIGSDGRLVWEKTLGADSSTSHICTIAWRDGSLSDCVAIFGALEGTPVRIWDAAGNELELIDNDEMIIAMPADLLGDSREELILIAKNRIRVYANTEAAQPKKWHNSTNYPGE